MERAAEIKRQLEEKRAELLAIQKRQEAIISKEESRTGASRDEFQDYCGQARERYLEFEENIKKVEMKLSGEVSTQFDFNADQVFAKFKKEGLDNEQMFDFIRTEYLN